MSRKLLGQVGEEVGRATRAVHLREIALFRVRHVASAATRPSTAPVTFSRRRSGIASIGGSGSARLIPALVVHSALSPRYGPRRSAAWTPWRVGGYTTSFVAIARRRG